MIDSRSYDVDVVGTVRSYSPGFSVRSIVIQNPTGLWLYIPQARQYVTPQTLGAVVTIDPAAMAIDIQYVNNPTGGIPSVAAGSPITAFYSDSADDPYQGLNYGTDQNLVTLNTSIGNLITAVNSISAGYGAAYTGFANQSATGVGPGSTSLLIPAVAGKQIVVVAANFAWNILPNNALPTPRGEWGISIYDPSTGNSLATAVLSAETKLSDLQNYPDRTVISPVGGSLRVSGTNYSKVPTNSTATVIAYYYTK